MEFYRSGLFLFLFLLSHLSGQMAFGDIDILFPVIVVGHRRESLRCDEPVGQFDLCRARILL